MSNKILRKCLLAFLFVLACTILVGFLSSSFTSTSENVNPKQTTSEIIPYEENPFYFSWQGKPVFLLGAANYHSWTPISRPENVDIEKHMDRLAGVIEEVGSPNVKGFVRCLPYDPANHMHDGDVPKILQPWQQNEDGRYDLSQINPAWEERLHEYLNATLEREIMVSLEVWDDWSITRGPEGQYDPGPNAGWNSHPFNPKNNINYDELVLPTTTGACEAPFYSTIPSDKNNQTVLALQQNYVDRLMAIADNYPNVIINISNESRANLQWSRYWSDYIQQKLPDEYMVGDMPSTNRRDGGGQCQQHFNPLTLSLDPNYDFVDISQAVSGHEFNEIQGQVIGGAHRIHTYRKSMQLKEREKPLVVSKDYTRDEQGGTMVLWSRFVGGAASARFHRPAGDHGSEVVDFQHQAVKILGTFIAKIPFWKMAPTPDKIKNLSGETKANVLAEKEGHTVVQLIDGQAGDEIELALTSGQWNVEWILPENYKIQKKYTISVEKQSITLSIPEDQKHQIIHLYPAEN